MPDPDKTMTPEPRECKSIFFIGIGGIGMSALAEYFLYYGYTVGGYDHVRKPVSDRLEKLGAEIIYDDDPELLPEPFRAEEEGLRVVYTPAIHEDNRLRAYYSAAGVRQIKRSELLGQVTRLHRALCVAGSHGKTTTSSLLAHLMRHSHLGVNAFIGGLMLNYDSQNLLLDESSDYVVVEADEFDRSFHRLSPYAAVVTATEADHLDIYGTPAEYVAAFREFVHLVSPEGFVIAEEHAEVGCDTLQEGTRLFRYGASDRCDYFYSEVRYEGDRLFFDLHTPEGVMKGLELGTPIRINVLNATAAVAMALLIGLTEEEIRPALADYRGIHRRFERTRIGSDGPIVIDEYAHHPGEVKRSLLSIRELYPGKRLTLVFQPHLYSRTRDFMEEFGEALSTVDDVILAPIYPAREEPIPGITSEALLEHVTSSRKCVTPLDRLPKELEKHSFDVLVMMGAGDIEFEIPQVIDHLREVRR